MDSVLNVEVWRDALLNATKQLADGVSFFLPRLVGAALLILLGWGISRLAQALSRRAMARFGFDRLATQLGVSASLRGVLRERSMSDVLSRLVFWTLLLTFVLFAANTLQLPGITSTAQRLIAYLPRILGAALILVLGLMLGRAAQSVVASGAALGSIEQAAKVGSATNLALVFTAAILALEQLGVSTEILVSVITALVAALGLTMGAAFALGARPVIGHVLAGHFLRQRFSSGEEIELEGARGTVDHVGPVDTVLRDGDDLVSIPNSVLLEHTVKR